MDIEVDLSPEQQPSSHASASPPPSSRKRKRASYVQPNIYSAVAGHYSLHGHIPSLPPLSQENQNTNSSTTHPTTNRDTSKISRAPLTPSEVLFKSQKAPDRFEEPALDPYGAHRWLESRTMRREDVYCEGVLNAEDDFRQGKGVKDRGEWKTLVRRHGKEQSRQSYSTSSRLSRKPKRTILRPHPHSTSSRARLADDELPDSDLCKAIHRYASAFYTASSDFFSTSNKASQRAPTSTGAASQKPISTSSPSFQSMDETALLALAILLEETARAHVCPPRAPALPISPEPSHDTANETPPGRDGWRALLRGVDSDGEEIDPFKDVKEKAVERRESRARSRSRSRAWREREGVAANGGSKDRAS